MRKFVGDPLFHFLAAGILIFAVGSAMKPPATESAAIIVDRAALLEFIQYRSKAFEPVAAAALFDGLDEVQRSRLIADFVREEALVREAKSLGLDANDYVIRQRMVQKAEFLAEASAMAADATEDGIAAYYNANCERYASPPSATLTHVFFSFEKRSPEAAEAEALETLANLRAQKAAFNDATHFGDRFLFHKNYVDRTDDYIASQLGDEAVAAIFDPSAPLNEWRGPYRSQYGAHLIFVSARSPARTPPLDEIRELVKSDLAEELRQKAIDTAIAAIVAKYKVDNRISSGQ